MRQVATASRGRTEKNGGMKVITGRVVGGKIELETELEEGTPVAVLAHDDAGFHLTNEQEKELASALEAIRRGEFVDGYQLLSEIRGQKHG